MQKQVDGSPVTTGVLAKMSLRRRPRFPLGVSNFANCSRREQRPDWAGNIRRVGRNPSQDIDQATTEFAIAASVVHDGGRGHRRLATACGVGGRRIAAQNRLRQAASGALAMLAQDLVQGKAEHR